MYTVIVKVHDSPEIIGRYAIYGKIAQGGMAAVHFARLRGAAGFSRTVAVKRLHPHLADEPEFLSTLVDEARLAARIHHPNVVPTLDVLSENGELLIVMEYVRGESLGRLLRAEAVRKRRVPLPVASAIVLGALHGLHAAHEATNERGERLQIVHRDVSPQNILVGADGTARVIDFGVAKAAGRLQTTREGVVKGKVAYMAPEQLAGLQVTRRVDVYAMGVVLWEVLTGRNLFKGDSDAPLVMKVVAGVTEPPSAHARNLPADLDALVMTALSRDPAHRFASAREMADQLVRVLPPAQPTDVAAWVEELAREGLSQRAAALAEIESASSMATVRPPGAKGAAPQLARAGAGAPSVASQLTAVSVEMELPGKVPRWTGPRARFVVAIAGALLIGAGLEALVLRPNAGASSREPPRAPALDEASAHDGPAAVSAGAPAGSSSVAGSPAPSATLAIGVPSRSVPSPTPAAIPVRPRTNVTPGPARAPAQDAGTALRYANPD
jgi:serine/threonine-protein kinase